MRDPALSLDFEDLALGAAPLELRFAKIEGGNAWSIVQKAQVFHSSFILAKKVLVFELVLIEFPPKSLQSPCF